MLKKHTDIFNEGAWKVINRFVQFNSYFLSAGLVFTFIYLNYKIGSLANTVEETLGANTKYIKENIGHPIFLSATGQVIVADKSQMSYYDDRFKQYIVNNLVDNLIVGIVKVSHNYKTNYLNAQDLLSKYERFKNFATLYANGNSVVIQNYANGIHLAIVENKLPEYIDVINAQLETYRVVDTGEIKGGETAKNGIMKMDGTLILDVVVKSWVPAKNAWDTRTSTVKIMFEADIDTAKYANVGNPFGINFTKIELPVMLKPQNIDSVQ